MSPPKKRKLFVTVSFVIKLILTLIAVIAVIILETNWPVPEYVSTGNPIPEPREVPPEVTTKRPSPLTDVIKIYPKPPPPPTTTTTTAAPAPEPEEVPIVMPPNGPEPRVVTSKSTTGTPLPKRRQPSVVIGETHGFARRHYQDPVRARRSYAGIDDAKEEETTPMPSYGYEGIVPTATRQQGIRNRVGMLLEGDGSWPQIKPHIFIEEDDFVSDEEVEAEDYALIHRTDYTTYAMLHASVYTHIGIFVTLIITHLLVDTHPPLESTLMFTGVILHTVTIYLMSVLAHSFRRRSLHYKLTIVVIVLMAVMTLLMALDCVLMWMMEGKRKPRKRLRKPPRQRST